MGTLRIEGTGGEPTRDLPRERYDLLRRSILEPKSVCHAPFSALHLGRTLAPCRHSTLDLGDARRTSLAQGFGGETVARMRERFKQYLVRRDECAACVHHWEDDAAAESPAQAEYDRSLPPLNGAPPRLRALSVDARATLPKTRVDEAIALLPELEQLLLVCPALEASGPARRLLTAVDRLPTGRRPKLAIVASGFVPTPASLPPSVTTVDVELPLSATRLDPPTRARIAALVDELGARDVPLVVRTHVGCSNWLELKRWLADVLASGATPVVEPIARDAPDSLAGLDADLIAALHGVLYRWSRELGVDQDDRHGAASYRRLLGRLRQWQKAAAERAPDGASLALPELDHALLRDEDETRRLLEDFLRVYHHQRVEAWLARVVQHRDFVRLAGDRLSLRLVALWLGCVFEHHAIRPALRAIYHDPAAAIARVEGDRAQLAGSPMAGWHDGWVKSLELEKQPRDGPPFEVPPPAAVKAGARARVTVVIPSFNHERYVGTAIDSVLAQSGARVRLLVLDDASTDGTYGVASARRDPRLEVRRNRENVGLGETLHRALKSVSTPYVAVLNSDDVFHPQRIATLLEALERRPRAEVAASLLSPVDGDGRACALADSSPIFDGKRVHDWLQWFDAACRKPPTSGDLVRPLLERNYLVTSSNLVARRDFLLRHAKQWRDLEYCVDWQVFLAAAAQGSLRVVDEPLLAYRLHATNTVWFDEEREWRFYVESHRVVARTLELLLARARGGPESRFAAQLEVIAGHLAGNDAIDGAGLYLGLLLERLKIPSRAIRTAENRRWIQALESMRRSRLQVRDVVQALGDDFPELLRMRGERPYLRAARNQAEAVSDELDRIKWELQAALEDRRNVEKLWHQAERERDQEIAGKAELYQRLGSLEGEATTARTDADAARRERDAKEAELRRLSEVRSDLQSTLKAVQGEHEHLRKDLDHALGALRGGKREDGGRDRDYSEREREALRLTLERLHEESAHLQGELERTRSALDATRQRAQAEQDVERGEAVRRLEEERTRLVALFEAEKGRLQAALDHEREEHAQTFATAQAAAADRLAVTLAAEAKIRVELADEAARRESELKAASAAEREALLARAAEERAELERTRAAERETLIAQGIAAREALAAEATAELDALRAEAARQLAEIIAQRDSLRAGAESLTMRVAELADRTRKLELETARLQALANQRAWEREELRRGPEYRFGNLVLNKMKLRRPLRAMEKGLHGAKVGLASARLAGERRGLLARGGGRPRVFSTICWNFPIWSQTFVYQELTQMAKRGFDLRLVYSKLEPKDHLPQQFGRLWDLKRVMHLDRAIHRRDYERFKTRFPDRVEQLTQKLCAASGLSREALEAHDNFLQGFTYARMAEAWGAQYLHSYFFYDRSLMSLIAGEVLRLPRGVSCYADHVMDDYELKVVPLHLQTCDVVVATSARIKRELLAIAPDTPADKILVKPNAIDCTRFPVLPRAEPAPGEPFRLVVTSRIEPKKGLVYLVEAVKRLRDEGIDVEAHFVGDVDKGVATSENYKAELCDLITRLDLWGKIHLEGRQPEQGVRKFLSLAQVFVAPFVETEYGDKDGIPTALVEALATGIPAVVTDAGSILEVVDDRLDARVVPQRDPAALARALRELLLDPKGRRLMGHKAAQKAREKFDVSVCEPWLHDRVRSLLAAPRK